MASIQSYILKILIRRLKLFGEEKADPLVLRSRIEQLAGKFKTHRKVQVVAVDADSVPAEWLIPCGESSDSALLYIHGGGWFMGSTNTHRALVSYLAYAIRIRALSINYRLAPENPFPAGLDDCITAYDWLLKIGIPPDKIVVAGDSAGGNLALALLIALRNAGKPLPAGAVCLSPATDLAGTGMSHKTRAHLDPYFKDIGPTNTTVKDYIRGHDPRDPLISPLYANLSGLPPLLLHVGDHEVLLDDTVRFGDRAVAAGVEAKTVVWPHMFHVFHVFAPFLPEARQANEEIAEFIRSRLTRKLRAS